MKQQEIIQSEQRVSNEGLYKIHLYLEGDWWRAYEWSAYLCEHYPNNLKEQQRLKPTHRHLKNSENGIIFIGLKLSSFDKYLPNISNTDKINQIDDKHMILDVSNIYSSPVTIDDYVNLLNEWKDSVPCKETIVSNKVQQLTSSEKYDSFSLVAVMQQILGYPLEKKTMIENTLFLSQLKEELSKLI